MKKSALKTTFQQLGITSYSKYTTASAEDQMLAIIQNLYLAGYIKRERVWQDIHFIGVSNQPYVCRQAMSAQRTVKSILQECGHDDVVVKVDGVGDACEVGVAAINSDLGALSGEQYFSMVEGQERARNANQLMYRDRNKDLAVVPEFDEARLEQLSAQMTNLL